MTDGPEDRLIMAFRYDGAKGLVTVIGDLQDLQLEGSRNRSGNWRHGAKVNTKP